MEPPIIEEIEKLEFEDFKYGGFEVQHFTIYKEAVKQAMRLIDKQYGDIAHHFEIRETTFAYDMRKSHEGEQIEIPMPNSEVHYMTDRDTIALNYRTLTKTCWGVKHDLFGSFPDECDKRYFKMQDFIFLVYCGQAYASHVAKIEKIAEVPIDQFDIEPMMRAHKAIVEIMIIERKIKIYTWSAQQKKYICTRPRDHKSQQ